MVNGDLIAQILQDIGEDLIADSLPVQLDLFHPYGSGQKRSRHKA